MGLWACKKLESWTKGPGCLPNKNAKSGTFTGLSGQRELVKAGHSKRRHMSARASRLNTPPGQGEPQADLFVKMERAFRLFGSLAEYIAHRPGNTRLALGTLTNETGNTKPWAPNGTHVWGLPVLPRTHCRPGGARPSGGPLFVFPTPNLPRTELLHWFGLNRSAQQKRTFARNCNFLRTCYMLYRDIMSMEGVPH